MNVAIALIWYWIANQYKEMFNDSIGMINQSLNQSYF